MPITIELEKNPFLREIVEHVRKVCSIENIAIVLRARFGVSLPEDLSERLQELPQQELDEMMGRSATAATADEVLMVRLKHIDFRIGSRAKKGSAR